MNGQLLQIIKELESKADIQEDLASLYKGVPWLRRAVDLVVHSVQTFPVYFQTTHGDAVDPPGWVQDFQQIIDNVVLDYLLYGRSAMRIIDGSTSSLTAAEHIPGWSIARDSSSGVWYSQTQEGRQVLSEDDVVFWLGVSPDGGLPVSPLESARTPAWVALKIIEMVGLWFNRGAIHPVILIMDRHPMPSEQEELRSWWKRLMSGLQNAFRPIAVGGVKDVKELGSTPDAWGVDILLQEARRAIAVAVGVPVTMLEDAANYATAKEHRLQFYENTVRPITEIMWGEVNRMLRHRKENVEAVVSPSDLEIYQKDEAEKAAAATQLYSMGIITLAEAREYLGWEPLPEQAVEQQEQEQEQQVEETESKSAETEWGEQERKAFLYDLERWVKKVERVGDVVRFRSKVIPLQAYVRVLEAGDVVEAKRWMRGWLQVKKDIPPRDRFIPFEQELSKIIYDIMRKYRPKFEKRLQKGERFDDLVVLYSNELLSAMRGEMESIARDALAVYEAEFGVFLTPEQVDKFAGWAPQYIEQRVNLIQRTTQQTLEAIYNDVQKQNIPANMIEEEVKRRIEKVFDGSRAERIAVTELTATISASSDFYSKALTDMGVRVVRRWRTQADERVCPICQPKDGLLVPDQSNGEPPAHTNCRCSVIVEVIRNDSI